MAPAALTLRFFSLPFITLIWLEELLTLRSQIYKKKEIISKINKNRRKKNRTGSCQGQAEILDRQL
jgi:arsenite-transporting ATPase